jgi:hypothetical protein
MHVARMLRSATRCPSGVEGHHLVQIPEPMRDRANGTVDEWRALAPVGGGNQRAALSQPSTRVTNLRKDPSILSVTSLRSSPLPSPA